MGQHALPAQIAEAKVALSFQEISRRIRDCAFPDVDRVVGIGSGGTVPAALVAFHLARPLSILPVNYRAADNTPRHDRPLLLSEIAIPDADRRLLLVDDVSVSGQTLAIAREALGRREIVTLVMKGRADIVLFPEIGECVHWPWNLT